MRRLIYLMAGIMLCFSSCDEPFDSAYRVDPKDPIALYLESQPEFSDWVAVLKKTNLFNSLNLTAMQTTHFVANNEALKKYAKEVFGADNILDVNIENLTSLIRYHTIPNYKISARNMSGKIGRRTATKDYLTAVYEYATNTRYILNGDKAPSYFIKTDIEVTNGYIQVLDTPLVTEFKNLWEVLKERDEYSIFCDGLEAAGLDAYLRNGSVEFELGLDKRKMTAKEEKTVFAVPNEAYANYSIENVEDLKRYIDAEVGPSNTPANKNAPFYQYMVYHIVPKRLAYTDLALFPLNPKTNDGLTRFKRSTIYAYNPVKALRKGISIEDQLSGLVFNPQESNVGNSFSINSIGRDIPASNGYVHMINNIMLRPQRIAYFPVEIEPTDEMEFRAIEFYQDFIAEGAPAKTFDLYNGDVSTLSWTTSSSDTRVWYSNVWMDKNRFLNQDALYFTLGSVGYIDFAIPPLPVTGTRDRLSLWIEKGIDSYAGGKYNTSLNRQELYNNYDFKNGAIIQECGRVRFGEEETTLVVRFKVGDFGGVGAIDRFIFVPSWSGGTFHPELYYYWEQVP